MYIYRHTNSHLVATTEEALAAKFPESGFKRSTAKSAEAEPIYLDGGDGEVISATLTTTYHNSFGAVKDAAKAHLLSSSPRPMVSEKETLQRSPLPVSSTNSESDTLCTTGSKESLKGSNKLLDRSSSFYRIAVQVTHSLQRCETLRLRARTIGDRLSSFITLSF